MVVQANVNGRDIGSYVEEARTKVDAIALAPGLTIPGAGNSKTSWPRHSASSCFSLFATSDQVDDGAKDEDVMMMATIKPPITTIARGFWTSAPRPEASEDGCWAHHAGRGSASWISSKSPGDGSHRAPSSSARAKYAEALRWISLARRSSFTSRSSSFSRSRSCATIAAGPPFVGSPPRGTRVSPVQPIFAAVELITAHSEP